MTATLPDFALEVYLGRHEFSAKHYLCGSDAQTLTVRELLDLANDARPSTGCRCRTHPPGADNACSTPSPPPTTRSTASTC